MTTIGPDQEHEAQRANEAQAPVPDMLASRSVDGYRHRPA